MFTLNCKGRLLIVDKPLLMGIINITPDSFYHGSRQQDKDAVVRQAEFMLKNGADIIDLGAQSTRPGSQRLTAAEEWQRLAEPLSSVHQYFPEAFISVDTYYSEVAKDAVAAGACIINDISAGSMDADMLPVVASLGVPYVLMHMQGNPQTMQEAPHYANVTREVLDYLIVKADELRKSGIHDIIIDPGFGFGKTISHNFELLRNLAVFKTMDCPVLLGISRKSTIYKTLGVTSEQALNGTTALNMIGLMNGANILRVHDIKEAKETIELYQACMG